MGELAAGHNYLPAWFLRSCAAYVEGSEPASDLLSAKEVQILRRVVAGQRSREIAAELKLSPGFVETYRSRVMRKVA